MTTRVRSVLATFGWWQWTLTAVFVVALLVTGMFAARTVSYSIYWRLHHREPIERWMPIGYIAHSYDVPPDVLERALGMPERRPPARPDRRPIGDIATSQGKSFDDVKATLQNAIANWKPPPPPDKSGDPPPPPADRAGP